VEGGLELRAVVGLDLLDLERQPRQDVVEELDRGLVVRAGIDPQDAQPSAVVDRGVLIELSLSLVGVGSDRLDELDIDLELVTRPLFHRFWWRL
jgi:hypothetical protein